MYLTVKQACTLNEGALHIRINDAIEHIGLHSTHHTDAIITNDMANAEKFLAEVEGVVLDTMMGKLFGQSGATVSAIDSASRLSSPSPL